jgi:hypothetical protein
VKDAVVKKLRNAAGKAGADARLLALRDACAADLVAPPTEVAALHIFFQILPGKREDLKKAAGTKLFLDVLDCVGTNWGWRIGDFKTPWTITDPKSNHDIRDVVNLLVLGKSPAGVPFLPRRGYQKPTDRADPPYRHFTKGFANDHLVTSKADAEAIAKSRMIAPFCHVIDATTPEFKAFSSTDYEKDYLPLIRRLFTLIESAVGGNLIGKGYVIEDIMFSGPSLTVWEVKAGNVDPATGAKIPKSTYVLDRTDSKKVPWFFCCARATGLPTETDPLPIHHYEAAKGALPGSAAEHPAGLRYPSAKLSANKLQKLLAEEKSRVTSGNLATGTLDELTRVGMEVWLQYRRPCRDA